MKKVFYIFLIFFLIGMAFIIGLGTGFIFKDEDGFKTGDKVALLSIEGVILDSKIYLESITSIKKDKNIKALVLIRTSRPAVLRASRARSPKPSLPARRRPFPPAAQ